MSYELASCLPGCLPGCQVRLAGPLLPVPQAISDSCCPACPAVRGRQLHDGQDKHRDTETRSFVGKDLSNGETLSSLLLVVGPGAPSSVLAPRRHCRLSICTVIVSIRKLLQALHCPE